MWHLNCCVTVGYFEMFGGVLTSGNDLPQLLVDVFLNGSHSNSHNCLPVKQTRKKKHYIFTMAFDWSESLFHTWQSVMIDEHRNSLPGVTAWNHVCGTPVFKRTLQRTTSCWTDVFASGFSDLSFVIMWLIHREVSFKHGFCKCRWTVTMATCGLCLWANGLLSRNRESDLWVVYKAGSDILLTYLEVWDIDPWIVTTVCHAAETQTIPQGKER